MRASVFLLLLAAATTFQLSVQKASDYRAATEQGGANSQFV